MKITDRYFRFYLDLDHRFGKEARTQNPKPPPLECPWRRRYLPNLNIVHPAIFRSPLITNLTRNSPLCHVMTHRRPKPVLSRNPLHRVLQSESTPHQGKVRVMSAQQGDDDSPIPTAACRWKKETLDLLNAKYNIDSVTPFKFGELLKLPSELQKGMTLH